MSPPVSLESLMPLWCNDAPFPGHWPSGPVWSILKQNAICQTQRVTFTLFALPCSSTRHCLHLSNSLLFVCCWLHLRSHQPQLYWHHLNDFPTKSTIFSQSFTLLSLLYLTIFIVNVGWSFQCFKGYVTSICSVWFAPISFCVVILLLGLISNDIVVPFECQYSICVLVTVLIESLAWNLPVNQLVQRKQVHCDQKSQSIINWIGIVITK